MAATTRFTGAAESHAGLLQAADGGTILLDEVSELPPAMQVKLVRVLQDGEVWPVGSTPPQRVDVRVLACTNRDLLRALLATSFSPAEPAADRGKSHKKHSVNLPDYPPALIQTPVPGSWARIPRRCAG